jgi:threonine/homoserine/homoserine lactone efflux protein
MGEAIGQLLPFAVGVAISPLPIVAVVLMLVTPRARSNGPAFLAGWIVGIAVAGAILLAIAGPSNASQEGEPAAWVDWLKLVLGLLLILVAVRQWRARPHEGEEVPMPKWMGALDNFTPPKAAGAALVLGTINPKNLLFFIGGAAAVAQTGIPAGQQAGAWAVFCVLASIGVAAPVVIYFAMGERAAGLLDSLKNWMVSHHTAVMAVLCLIVGVKLVGDAITGFSG